jgi:glycosyltransferase involved in cell wall biosynthesis
MKDNSITNVSIIIPFYNRDEFIIEIINAIDRENQHLLLNIEIIFVDSNSSNNIYSIIKYIKNISDLNIRVINTLNSAGEKRNFGIKSAQSEYIICIDDDCIPATDFIKNHLLKLQNSNSEKVIYSGLVKFPSRLRDNSNYYRFRDYRHRVYDSMYSLNNEIDFHKFITMNMSFKKSAIIKNNLFFDTDYKTYGLEDTQFGLDAIKKGFSLQTCIAPIIHRESTSIDLFILKTRHFAQNYFFTFYKKNENYLSERIKSDIKSRDFDNHAPIIKLAKWRNDNSSKYRLAMKILRIIPISLKPIIYILKTYLNISDKTRILYSYKIYRFLMIIIVISTLFDRKLKTKNFI